MEASRGTHRAHRACAPVAALLAAAVLAPAARGAEVEATGPPEVTVESGKTAGFTLRVEASGQIDCGVGRGDPATATFDTVHSLVRGSFVSAERGRALPFYARFPQVAPPGCPVDWDGRPAPYEVTMTVAAAPDTEPGVYPLTLRADTRTPGFNVFPRLEDSQAAQVSVRVEPPPPTPELGRPLEDRSFNLLPVRKIVRVLYPGAAAFVRITEPVQIPPGSTVDTSLGYATLVSDRNGRGGIQTATFWQGVFEADYSRDPDLLPGGPRRARFPITELRVRPNLSRCGGTARVQASARRRRRGLWGRGRGRFRTRGRYGAGIVRGTHWFTADDCDGTYWLFRSGKGRISDFVARRSVRIFRNQSYLARPPGRGVGRGRG